MAVEEWDPAEGCRIGKRAASLELGSFSEIGQYETKKMCLLHNIWCLL